MTYFENTGIKDEISTDSNIPASYLKRVGATIVDILIWILAFAPSITLFDILFEDEQYTVIDFMFFIFIYFYYIL